MAICSVVTVVVNGSTPGQKMLGVILTATAENSNETESLGTFDVSTILSMASKMRACAVCRENSKTGLL